MPPLQNPRHERFVGLLLEGKSALDSYELAGFKRDDANAARLKANPKVRERLLELQNEVAAQTVVTIEGLIGELEAICGLGQSNSVQGAVERSIGRAAEGRDNRGFRQVR